ncbi:MAG TPA: hypothetical protein VGI39_16260, partial [Polyangiaceae bacterium]
MKYGLLGLLVTLATAPALGVILLNCGSSGDAGAGPEGGVGDGSILNGDGGSWTVLPDGNVVWSDAGSPYQGSSDASFVEEDCPGCSFPPPGAPPCAASAPPIQIVYPSDGVLVPPNMDVLSVQWTPFGPAYKEFEVDFDNAVTSVRVVTKCATQTTDTEQPPQPSGGCEVVLDPQMWAAIANVNRGGSPVNVTVRGTTDGT